MRRFLIIPLLALLCLAQFSASAATGRVIKMLPFFLDLQGRHSIGANLYSRDTYQVHLREHAEERSGMRFDINWKTHGTATAPLKIKLEMRGGKKGEAVQQLTLEADAKPGHWFSSWTTLQLVGDDYKNFGELVSWRVTLWDGDKQIGEQTSFLW